MFYAFTFEPPGVPGTFLGESLDLWQLVRDHAGSVVFKAGPTPGETMRNIEGKDAARVTFEPYRQALGVPGVKVQNLRPWLVFFNGEAVTAFETQGEALEWCEKKRTPCYPMLNTYNGKPWD